MQTTLKIISFLISAIICINKPVSHTGATIIIIVLFYVKTYAV